jgi:hypothetical protein
MNEIHVMFGDQPMLTIQVPQASAADDGEAEDYTWMSETAIVMASNHMGVEAPEIPDAEGVAFEELTQMLLEAVVWRLRTKIAPQYYPGTPEVGSSMFPVLATFNQHVLHGQLTDRADDPWSGVCSCGSFSSTAASREGIVTFWGWHLERVGA